MFSVDNLPQSDDTCHRDTTLSSGTLNIQSEQFSHQNQEENTFFGKYFILPKWDQTNLMSTPVQLLDKNILKEKSLLVSLFLF